MAQQYGLGRGLSSLIPPKKPEQAGDSRDPSQSQGASSPAPQPTLKQPVATSPFVINPVQRAGMPGADDLEGSFSQSEVASTIVPKTGEEVKSTETSVSGGAKPSLGVQPSVGVLKKPVVSLTTSFDQESVMNAPLHMIVPNPEQPRAQFDKEKLAELAQSIREHGILQPLVVTRKGDGYELIAGERRLQASKLAGLTEVPVIIRSADERTKLELAIIENTQRHNLNPHRRGQSIFTIDGRIRITSRRSAKKMGKSRSLVANTVRLCISRLKFSEPSLKGRFPKDMPKLFWVLRIQKSKEHCLK
jgi:ParB/RepB/Spo0J family partition protein